MDFLEKYHIFAILKNANMELTAQKQKNAIVMRTRKECPQNLSKAGRWAMKHPQGVLVIVNRKAVNK